MMAKLPAPVYLMLRMTGPGPLGISTTSSPLPVRTIGSAIGVDVCVGADVSLGAGVLLGRVVAVEVRVGARAAVGVLRVVVTEGENRAMPSTAAQQQHSKLNMPSTRLATGSVLSFGPPGGSAAGAGAGVSASIAYSPYASSIVQKQKPQAMVTCGSLCVSGREDSRGCLRGNLQP